MYITYIVFIFVFCVFSAPALEKGMSDQVNNAQGIFAIIGSLIGVVASGLWIIPCVMKIKKRAEIAEIETKKFIRKWKEKLSDDLRDDIKLLLSVYDELFEKIADLLSRIGLKNKTQFLRDLIRKDEL